MASQLIVANRTLGSERLFARALQVLEEDGDAHLVLLVPARPIPVRFEPVPVGEWPIASGTRRARRLARRLLSAGAAEVQIRPGPSDPAEAIEEAVSGGGFTVVLISTLAPPHSSWLRLDLPRRVALRHPELDVRHVIASRESQARTG